MKGLASQRFLLGFQQAWRVGPDAVERIRPLGRGRALRMEAECGRIEEDAFAGDLFDHRTFGQHVLERITCRKAALHELEASQLGERMILVDQQRSDPVLGAQVAQEDRDDQSVSLVARHLDEACGDQQALLIDLEVTEVLHFEKTTRARARDPWPIAAPRAGGREGLELLVNALEAVLRQAVKTVVKDSLHGRLSLP